MGLLVYAKSIMSTFLSYIADELRANYDDTFWWRNRLLHRVVGPLQGLIYGTDGIDVMGEDWDTLIILDACRADTFEEVADLERFDEYRVVTSRASATPEFVAEHYVGKEFGDTVYVNSNPHISRDAPGSFHHRYDLWDEAFDEEYGTVLPATSKEWALRTAREYPNKRMIVHYNQPHGPYIGEDRIEWDYDLARGSGEALKKGLVSEDAFRRAYRANLVEALPTALDIAAEVPGRTVITSDHGELFGKRQFPIPLRAYAHPPGLRDPDLVRVPWAVIEGDERPEIVDDGVQMRQAKTDVVNERLEDLGYKV
ncbi:MAG: hypothetical protein ABEI99_03575 [Halobaculum sp.]